jgi:hypothetical protein
MHTDIVRAKKSWRLQVDTGEYKASSGQKIHNFSHTLFNYPKVKQNSQQTYIVLINSK